jgi:hypothetical protein
MKMIENATERLARRSPSARRSGRAFWLATVALGLCLLALAPSAVARQQTSATKLPSPEKIVAEYQKALGGKKRVAAAREAVYEWEARAEGAEAGTALVRLKSPSSLRLDLMLGGASGEAANASTAWALERDGRLRTLTDAESLTARLQALLEASRFADFKKRRVLARTVALEDVNGEPAYAVEFSTKAGARLRYWFGASSRVVLRMADDARRLRVLYADWRERPDGALAREPHRLEITREGAGALVLTLRAARYNQAIADTLFDPPGDTSLDIAALLRELSANQSEVDRRINDYTFTRKVVEREVTDRGEVKKEKVFVYEVYPVAGWGWVQKLVAEDGRPLAPERAAKEEKRAAEQLQKAESELPKLEQKRERQRAERAAKKRRQDSRAASAADETDEDEGDDNVRISTFLRACELVSPRRERFRERDAVVFDFRPRAGFRPRGRAESLVSKLSGVIWIDPADRQVMRLEARLVEGIKIGGGLLASVRPGSAFVFEQTRLPDGVWLPRFSQINASAKVFLFAGVQINETHEFSDYKRFSARTGEDRIDNPEKP